MGKTGRGLVGIGMAFLAYLSQSVRVSCCVQLLLQYLCTHVVHM